jgi:hypothetical protein
MVAPIAWDRQRNPVERTSEASGDTIGDIDQPGGIFRFHEVLVAGIAITAVRRRRFSPSVLMVKIIAYERASAFISQHAA